MLNLKSAELYDVLLRVHVSVIFSEVHTVGLLGHKFPLGKAEIIQEAVTQPDHVIWVRCFVVVFSEQSGHVTKTLCSPWQGLSGAVYYSIIEPFKVEL